MRSFELRAAHALTLTLSLSLSFAVAGCEQQPPAAYPPGQPPPGQFSPGQFQQGGIPQGQGQGGPMRPPMPAPIPPNPNDPINLVDMMWLRQTAGGILQELVAALPPQHQEKVRNIPLVTDQGPGDVNAFAACNAQGEAAMGITDGLLQIQAFIAQFRATDDVFGTRKLDAYLAHVAQHQREKEPVVLPPQGLIDPAQNADGRKLARQHQLLGEQIAFVLGHELAHHYLGHTGCVVRGAPGTIDLGRILQRASRIIPTFNQVNELAADASGTENVLAAGMRRAAYVWNEEGAMLTLEFFQRMEAAAQKGAFSFMSTHPPSNLRAPIVQNAATNWRARNPQPMQPAGYGPPQPGYGQPMPPGQFMGR